MGTPVFGIFKDGNSHFAHREVSLSERATRGLALPQDAQGMSTEEVVVADVLVPCDIHHLQREWGEGSRQGHC